MSMTASGAISAIGYLTIRTTDLEASVTDAVEVLGLRVVERTDHKAFLTAAVAHHEIVYVQDDHNSVDHFGVAVDSRAELDALRAKVERAGYPIISDGPIEDHVEEGFAFVGPDDYTWQPHVALGWRDTALTGGYGPNRLGHITYTARDVNLHVKFLTDVFDMRVSDQVGEHGRFLRCNSDHHGIGLAQAPEPALAHHAWATQSLLDIGRLADRLAQRGRKLARGPIRHKVGNNIAGYYVEPSGGVVELYTDMEQIHDRERPPRYTELDDPYWANMWNDGVPDPKYLLYNTVPFDRGVAVK